MTAQERISELLNEIKENKTRNNSVFDTNISKIKEVLISLNPNGEYMTRYLIWSNETVVDYKERYERNLGIYKEDEVIDTILQLVFDLEENNNQ